MKLVIVSFFVLMSSGCAALAQSVSFLLSQNYEIVATTTSGSGLVVMLKKDKKLYACYAEVKDSYTYVTKDCRVVE